MRVRDRESTAGLVGDVLHATPETPLHSVLHETEHWICLGPDRRVRLHADAGGNAQEESAVCSLQVLLADAVPGLGRERQASSLSSPYSKSFLILRMVSTETLQSPQRSSRVRSFLGS
jgi:hypothetical protein